MLYIFRYFLICFFIFSFCYAKNLKYSIYNLNLSFLNQENVSVNLNDLKGDVKVISMIYTRCKTTCPTIVENMKKIFSLLPINYRDKVHFILISLDPKYDSYSIMKEFGLKKGLNFQYWSLLTGTPDDVLQLAVSLGFKYKKEIDGTYIHSNLILILDKNGIVRYNHPGLNDNFHGILDVIYSIEKI